MAFWAPWWGNCQTRGCRSMQNDSFHWMCILEENIFVHENLSGTCLFLFCNLAEHYWLSWARLLACHLYPYRQEHSLFLFISGYVPWTFSRGSPVEVWMGSSVFLDLLKPSCSSAKRRYWTSPFQTEWLLQVPCARKAAKRQGLAGTTCLVPKKRNFPGEKLVSSSLMYSWSSLHVKKPSFAFTKVCISPL